MNFEEKLKAEFGEEKVSIDYTKMDNKISIKIISKDGSKEFNAQGVLFLDECIEIGGRKYTVEDLILALNTSFNKKN